MDDLSYQTPDFSGDADAVKPARAKKMKTVQPSMRLHKKVPKWLVDMPVEKKIKAMVIIEKTGHSVDTEYGEGKAEVTLSFHSIEKVANSKMTKKEYLNASPDDREKHNKETVMGKD